MDSVLTSIKKLLGITEEYDQFDQDLIMHINSVLMVLTQIGVGPSNGMIINDSSTTGHDILSDTSNIEAVKTYVYLKVKMIFDPPSSSSVADAMNRSINEYEWRLNINADSQKEWLQWTSQLL